MSVLYIKKRKEKRDNIDRHQQHTTTTKRKKLQRILATVAHIHARIIRLGRRNQASATVRIYLDERDAPAMLFLDHLYKTTDVMWMPIIKI